MPTECKCKPKLLVSACLTGRPVRYDGKHKRNSYITDALSKHFELIPICPEMAAGMPSPRPTIDLHIIQKTPKPEYAVFNRTSPSINPTALISRFAKEILTEHMICGVIGVSRSPSCATQSARLYDHSQQIAGDFPGLFIATLLDIEPCLPVIEDELLCTPEALNKFLCEASAFHHKQCESR